MCHRWKQSGKDKEVIRVFCQAEQRRAEEGEPWRDEGGIRNHVVRKEQRRAYIVLNSKEEEKEREGNGK